MFINLISWTGWSQDDWIEAVINAASKITGLAIVGSFAYGSMWCLAFLAGC